MTNLDDIEYITTVEQVHISIAEIQDDRRSHYRRGGLVCRVRSEDGRRGEIQFQNRLKDVLDTSVHEAQL